MSVGLRHGSRGWRVILERQVGGIWVEKRNVRDRISLSELTYDIMPPCHHALCSMHLLPLLYV